LRYTPWIVSQHVPDYSTLEDLVRSPQFAGKAGQDLAIALWRLMVDRDLGIFHYFPAQEAFWGKDVFDPLKVFNVYGFTICHIHANVLAMLYKAAGLPARIAHITGHEGTEALYDGAWHYFDADIQMFHRLRPPRHETIASREDLYRDPSLVDEQPNPSNPYHMPDRLPEYLRKLYESKPHYSDFLEERIHSMDFRLRPGEELTRYFHHRGRWIVFPTYPEAFARYRSETGPEGPTERFWPRRQWGNGYLRYAPRISSGCRDVEVGADKVEGLELHENGLVCAKGRGCAVFAFESPYIYCGISDPMRRVPSVNGAMLSADFALPANTAARVEGSPERSEDWQLLWSSAGQTGEVTCKVDFTALAEARYRLRLRFVLEGAGATLKGFETMLWFMVSPHSLPALRAAGENRMRLHSGDAFGLNSRTFMLECMFNTRESIAAACATHNLRHEPGSFARLVAADPARPWQVTYELAAPAGGKMAWAAVYTIIEGRKPGEGYDGHTARVEIADSTDGPWQVVAEKPILEHPQGWHFGLFGQGRFSGQSGKGYVRLSARKGALGVRIAAHYVPREAPVASLLEIEHAWYEDDPRVGRRLRTHLERTEKVEHAYVVRCENEPHDERITLRVLASGR
jgi:hypothetical protein